MTAQPKPLFAVVPYLGEIVHVVYDVVGEIRSFTELPDLGVPLYDLRKVPLQYRYPCGTDDPHEMQDHYRRLVELAA